jgi:hypothetical protein
VVSIDELRQDPAIAARIAAGMDTSLTTSQLLAAASELLDGNRTRNTTIFRRPREPVAQCGFAVLLLVGVLSHMRSVCRRL